MSKYTYIARQKCGCVVAAHVIDPQWAADTAKTLKDWAKRGMTAEIIPHEQFKSLPYFGCRCNPKEKQRSLLEAHE